MNTFFSARPIWQNNGLFLIRVITAIFLIIHGMEVFDSAKMAEYVKWDPFKTTSFMPYLGKGAEFVGGVLLLLGLFTRPACLLLAGTFLYIVFFIGGGKFWMEDQHPFLFAMLAMVFFFTGPGAFSADEKLFTKNA